MPATHTFSGHGSFAEPNRHGDTLFEQMRRAAEAPMTESGLSDIPQSLHPTAAQRELVVVDAAEVTTNNSVRFSRGKLDGTPAVVMQERGSDGDWGDTWSLPTESVDAREGMIGWLNTQSYRWPRFATMYHRRGGEELTRWIFELMVVPTTGQARAPRYEPQRWPTIQQYASASLQRGDCGCRAGSIQHTRDF